MLLKARGGQPVLQRMCIRRRHRKYLKALVISLLVVLGSCNAPTEAAIVIPPQSPPEILSIAVLSPALEGTPLRVETRGLEASLPTLLRLEIPGTTGSVLLDESASESVGSTRQFPLNRTSIEYLGLGEVTVDATIVQGTMSSLPVPRNVDETNINC